MQFYNLGQWYDHLICISLSKHTILLPQLVPWTPPDIEEGLELYMRVLQADCSTDTVQTL